MCRCSNQKVKTLALYTIEVLAPSVIIIPEIEEYLKNKIYNVKEKEKKLCVTTILLTNWHLETEA